MPSHVGADRQRNADDDIDGERKSMPAASAANAVHSQKETQQQQQQRVWQYRVRRRLRLLIMLLKQHSPCSLLVLVALVLVGAILLDRSTACSNSPGTKITIRVSSNKNMTMNKKKRTLTCSNVQKNLKLCQLMDLRTGKRVKRVCRAQCLRKCQRRSSLTTSTGDGIQPVAPPSSDIPPGPYYTSNSNSQVITLPDPSTPKIRQGSNRYNCPHLKSDLKSWHDPSTWPDNAVPVDGAKVTLPSNTKVVIHQSIGQKLGYIKVPPSSQLIIGENKDGISILAQGIHVQGKLVAGAETCRLETPVKITLWGKRPADAVQNRPSIYSKGIFVTGSLSLHGKRYFSTWSRLAKTINAGESILLLQRPVNWESGQHVVLTPSIMYDSRAYHQNEVVSVDRVETAANTPAGLGSVVYLQQAVQYKHIANEYYQVEAGLLSRTILVQGSADDSEPTDKDPLNCRMEGFESTDFLYDLPAPCTNMEKTGYGGHIMIASPGTAQVEGIELYRMGQTNIIGRYPIHFHLLESCPTCYFKDSSVHRSYYRCISIHGTHEAMVSENVAYDVIGYCYYLEDGIEQDNTFSYNLAAHIHTIGPDLPTSPYQGLDEYIQSAATGDELTLPADVTASGFYITNVHNNVIGNAASGGYSGFAFPVLDTPLGLHRDVVMRPGCASGLKIDGNTAHSTGLWWHHAGAFYLGGSFYFLEDGSLSYNPGRANSGRGFRQPCTVAPDCSGGSCRCTSDLQTSLNMTNTKSFLTAGVGLNSWGGMMNIEGYEAYDQRLAIEALSEGFWLDNMYAACRTGEDLGLPSPGSAARLEGSGFYWYDTGQNHVITNAVFQNCGYRSEAYSQYSTSPTRGCGDISDAAKGCREDSTTFGFVTHSDTHIPEIMQGTKGLTFSDSGRIFRFTEGASRDSIAGRSQNWVDVDGSASGLGEPTIIGSGLPSVKNWWGVDNDVIFDEQGPLSFIKKSNGPSRGVGHVRFSWDPALHAKTDIEYCFNGNTGTCPIEGYVRHAGYKFSPTRSGASQGFPVALNPDAVGPVGGYGWILGLNGGAPRDLNITELEFDDPDSTLLLSIAYPVGTVLRVTANAEPWCGSSSTSQCREFMEAVSSIDQVRRGHGNTYHVDANGVFTMRVFMLARDATGSPRWNGVPTYETPDKYGTGFSLNRFEREGVVLPQYSDAYFRIEADCGGSGVFCDGSVADYDPNVCPSGYEQVAYDKCCSTTNPAQCTFADGSKTTT